MATALAVARADLEALLRIRKLDRTLTVAAPFPGQADADAMATIGIGPLDRVLGGGLPRGQFSEVVGARSSGRTSVLMALLAGALCRGELAALIDPLDMFDPHSAAMCGVETRRLLWVRGEANGRSPGRADGRPARPGQAGQPGLAGVEQGLKALNLVLQAGGFGVVVLDMAEVPAALIKRAPWTTWLRLQRVIEGSRTACVMVGPEPMARSAGGVTIEMRRVGNGQWPVAGLEVEARVMRARTSAGSTCRFGLAGRHG